MTKLTWGAPGERRFETGVDRGVLYFDGTAHAWNGLISVDESPQGGSAQSYYYDGVKYAHLTGAEEFQATINAVTVPAAFDEIDGRKSIAPGFYAAEQPRRSFDFVYRSKIGSDTAGVDAGYKIHIIYNALAEPTSRTYQTMSDQTTPMELGWNITALPPRNNGYRPTAHYVVDSTKMAQPLLSVLEGILYGSEGVIPRLPQPQELLNMFGSWISIEPGLPIIFLGKKVRTIKLIENMYTNPSCERVSGASGYSRSNRVISPQPRSDANWGVAFGTGGNGTWKYGFDGVGGAPTLRVDWSSQPTSGIPRIIVNNGTAKFIPVTPGETLTFSIDVATSAREARLIADFRSTTAWVSSHTDNKYGIALSRDIANPTRLSTTFVVPEGIAFVQLFVGTWLADAVPGAFFTAARAQLESGNQAHPYIDGDTPHAVGATSAWAGTANNSTSTSTFTTVVRYTNLSTNPSFEASSGTVEVRRNFATVPTPITSRSWGPVGALSGFTVNAPFVPVDTNCPSVCAQAQTTATSGERALTSSLAGENLISAGITYTISFYWRCSENASVGYRFAFIDSSGAVIGSLEYGGNQVGKSGRVSLTKTAPAGAVRISIGAQISNAVSTPVGAIFQTTGVLIEQGAVVGTYFDGTYSPDSDLTPSWAGTANASASILTAPRAAYTTPSGYLALAYQSSKWAFSGSKSLCVDGTSMVSTNIAPEAIVAADNSVGWPALEPGKTYTAVAMLRLNAPGIDVINRMRRIMLYTSNNGGTTYVTTGSDPAQNVAGVHLVRWTFTIPADSNKWILRLGGNGSAAYGLTGDACRAWWDGFTIVEGNYPDLMPFDGFNSNDSDLYTAWTGTANASTSTVSVVGAISVSVGSNKTHAYMSDQWASTGSKSIRLTPLEVYSSSSSVDTMASPGGDTGAMRLGMVAGRTYTASAKIYLPSPQTGILNNQARSIVLFYKIGTGSYQSIKSTAAPNVAGVHEVTHTFTVPVGATEAFIRYYNGAALGGGDVWWDDFVLTPEPVNFFMGGTTPYEVLQQMVVPTWSGIEHGSTSRAEIITSLPSNPQLGEAWDISGTLYVWNGSVWTPYPMSTVPY